MHTHDFECTFYTPVDRDVSDNFFGATAWSFQNGFVIAIWKYILDFNIKILDKIWQNQASNLLNSIWQAIKKLSSTIPTCHRSLIQWKVDYGQLFPIIFTRKHQLMGISSYYSTSLASISSSGWVVLQSLNTRFECCTRRCHPCQLQAHAAGRAATAVKVLTGRNFTLIFDLKHLSVHNQRLQHSSFEVLTFNQFLPLTVSECLHLQPSINFLVHTANKTTSCGAFKHLAEQPLLLVWYI